MYDEDNSSEGGGKGSYEIFKAEGDVLYKKEEFQKALASYSTVSKGVERWSRSWSVDRRPAQVASSSPLSIS